MMKSHSDNVDETKDVELKVSTMDIMSKMRGLKIYVWTSLEIYETNTTKKKKTRITRRYDMLTFHSSARLIRQISNSHCVLITIFIGRPTRRK